MSARNGKRESRPKPPTGPTVGELLEKEEKRQHGNLRGLSFVRGSDINGKYADVVTVVGHVAEAVSVLWTRHRGEPTTPFAGSISKRSTGWVLLRER